MPEGEVILAVYPADETIIIDPLKFQDSDYAGRNNRPAALKYEVPIAVYSKRLNKTFSLKYKDEAGWNNFEGTVRLARNKEYANAKFYAGGLLLTDPKTFPDKTSQKEIIALVSNVATDRNNIKLIDSDGNPLPRDGLHTLDVSTEADKAHGVPPK
jgi:hypothetical protein